MSNSIIQDLIKEGVLVLYHDYRSGSVVDRSGNGNDGTFVGAPFWSNNGLQFPGSANVTVSDSLELRSTEGTIVIHSDFKSYIANERLIVKRDAGGTNWDWFVSATDVLGFYDGSSIRTIAVDIDNTKCHAINFKSGEISEGFVNGLSIGSYNAASTITEDDADVLIGSTFGASNSLSNTSYNYVLIINRKLTATEHSRLYAELESMSWPKQPTMISNAMLSVDPEPQRANGVELLVDGDMEAATTAAWNSISAGLLSKQSGVTPDGNGSLVLQVGCAIGDTIGIAQQIIVTSGKKYKIALWAKGDGVSGVPVIGNATGTDIKVFPSSSSSWQFMEIVFTATASNIYLGCSGNVATLDTAQFDNVSVQEVTGLVAGYDMKPVGGKLIDKSANGNDGTIVGARYEKTLLGDSLVFNGVDDTISLSVDVLGTGDLTVSGFFKPLGSGPGSAGRIIDSAQTFIWYDDLNARIKSTNNAGVNQATSATGSVPVGVPLHFVVTRTAAGLSNFYINGSLSGSADQNAGTIVAGGNTSIGNNIVGNRNLNGSLSSLKIYNKIVDTNWIEKEYNKGKTALWKTDFGAYESVDAVTSGPIENTPFQVSSGSFKVVGAPLNENELGVEKLVDGDMEAATTVAWTAASSPTLTKEVGGAKFGDQWLKIAYNGIANPQVNQPSVLQVGKTYRLSLWFKSDGSTLGRVGNVPAPFNLTAASNWTFYEYVFVATITTSPHFFAFTSSAGWVGYDNISIQEVLPTTKAIECVSSGTCYVPTSYFQQTPTEAAYGEWNYYINRTLDDGSTIFNFIATDNILLSSDNNGYVLYQQVGGTVVLGRVDAGAITTVIDTYIGLPIGDYYYFRITRSDTGLIKVYVTGGTFNNTEIISGTDNTYTTSEYINIPVRTTNKIAFSDVSGNYSIVKKLLS